MGAHDRPRWLDRFRDWLLGDQPSLEPVPRQSLGEKWDETAEELLEQTKLSAGQEETRAESLIGRAGVLLGFCGAAVALSAGAAKELLAQSRELGEPARDIAAYSLIAGLVLVVGAAVTALIAMRPREGRALSVEALKDFAEPEAYKTSRLEYRRRLQWSLADAVDKERPKNNRRARALRIGILLLAGGIACFTPTAALYALDAADGPECTTQERASTTRMSLFVAEQELPPPVTCPKQDKIFSDRGTTRG